MTPLPVKLTAKQRKDLRDGLPITILPPGGTELVIVYPAQIAHAAPLWQAGQPVFVLAPNADGTGMTEVTV